jgi:hypothetical protein
MKDVVESVRVGKAVRAQSKRCYWNAVRAIQTLPEYQDADYVEGFAVRLSPVRFPFEYGWLEKGGKVIDPTMPEEDLRYFAGLRWRGLSGLAEAKALPRPRGTPGLPIFFRLGWGGCDSPEFMRARAEAYRCAGLPLPGLQEGSA